MKQINTTVRVMSENRQGICDKIAKYRVKGWMRCK